MLYYRISHETRFEYHAPIRESIGEVRLRPRDERGQSCLQFDLSVRPRVRVSSYRDFLGNYVHQYGIPQTHISESITAESLVRIEDAPDWPDTLPAATWERYERLLTTAENWDMAQPSTFAKPTDALIGLADRLGIRRLDDPMSTARHACAAIHDHFEYQPDHTTVDSPVDDAITARGGVCQDFAHLLTALLRQLGMPTRYVSGYLFVERQSTTDPSPDQAPSPTADASHAWVEALLPTLGWVGFDPTHNELVTTRHIRTAVGRDYADVPPTRGVYRGNAPSDMHVAVAVTKLEDLPTTYRQPFATLGWVPPEPLQTVPDEPQPFEYYAQQMQQQQ